MFRYNVLSLFFAIFVLWSIKSYEIFAQISLAPLGVYPLKINGLKGLLFSPLIHGNINHLLANTFPLFILGLMLIYIFAKQKFLIIIVLYFIPNLIVWFVGRPAYHIGASSFIYGMASFIFFSGIFEKKGSWLALSLLIVFLYGGLIWGLIPRDSSVSFESHICGAVTGIFLAYFLKGKHTILDSIVKDDMKYSTTFDQIPFRYIIKAKRG